MLFRTAGMASPGGRKSYRPRWRASVESVQKCRFENKNRNSSVNAHIQVRSASPSDACDPPLPNESEVTGNHTGQPLSKQTGCKPKEREASGIRPLQRLMRGPKCPQKITCPPRLDQESKRRRKESLVQRFCARTGLVPMRPLSVARKEEKAVSPCRKGPVYRYTVRPRVKE